MLFINPFVLFYILLHITIPLILSFIDYLEQKYIFLFVAFIFLPTPKLALTIKYSTISLH